jgi:hypothetical protein
VISVNDPANPQEINSVEFEDDIKLYTTWQDSNGTEYPIAIVDNRYLKVFAFQGGEDLEEISSLDINPEDYYGGDISIATWADGVVIYTNYYYEDPVFTSFFRVVSLDNPQEPEVLGLLSSQTMRKCSLHIK